MPRMLRLQKYLIALLCASFVCGMMLGIGMITNIDLGAGVFKMHRTEKQRSKDVHSNLLGDGLENPKHHLPRDTGKEMEDDLRKEDGNLVFDNSMLPEPNYNVHVFYYMWYGNPEFDGEYLHWNHNLLTHWDKKESKKWPTGKHTPPDDIGSYFYPELGPYSSQDPKVIEAHMQQIRAAGAGVLAVSWYPPDQADEQGRPWAQYILSVMDMAHKYKLKVCLHIEPYKGRTPQLLRKHLQYVKDVYGLHPAYYQRQHHGKMLPLFYIYDSYLISREGWGNLLHSDGIITIRNTDLDGIFIGLLVEQKHQAELTSAGFDGFYTYFASDGFTYGSTTNNWGSLAKHAKSRDVLFIPSVGPGYIDVQIRPWNGLYTKDRERGNYYEESFKAALRVKPQLITVTSFNEWHEGTQIEKAVPKYIHDFKYGDYAPMGSDYYLFLTKKWAQKFAKLIGSLNDAKADS